MFRLGLASTVSKYNITTSYFKKDINFVYTFHKTLNVFKNIYMRLTTYVTYI